MSKNLRIVRLYNLYYVQKKTLGCWFYTDRYFRVFSFRRTRAYVNEKIVRAAYKHVVQNPFEVVEYLDPQEYQT